MRSVTSFNDGWLFEGKPAVSLPHTAVELPFAYFDERSYQRPFTYSKTFTADPAWTGKDVTLVFDGAMANAQVTINGEVAGGHADGYTPFEIRLTGRLKPGSNEIKVVIAGSGSRVTLSSRRCGSWPAPARARRPPRVATLPRRHGCGT